MAAMIAAEPKEIFMTKAKPKRKAASKVNGDKIKARSSSSSPARSTAHKTVKLRPGAQSTGDKRPKRSAQQNGKANSKQSQIIAMLRAPNGATIEAMCRAMGWQPNSVRGFLAGVVRKKIGLTLVSVAAESGRIYRITDQNTSSGVTARSDNAV